MHAGFVETLDLLLESELVDDLACRRREPADVGAEVVGDVLGVGGDFGEVDRGQVVELVAGGGAQRVVRVVDAPGKLLGAGEDGGLAVLEDAVEASDHDQRQDGAPVLGLLVGPAQQVGDGPDEVDLVGEVAAVGERHRVSPEPFASSFSALRR